MVRNMKSYLVVGTDTDCGKTHVMMALIRYLKHTQHTVMALKPVASGFLTSQIFLAEHDAVRLSQELDNISPQDICPWAMPLPVSPHLAAQDQNIQLSSTEIVQFCQQARWQIYDYLLIESAGGLLAPLNAQETWLDVIRHGVLEVIVVVGMRVGCINHALLTMNMLKQANLHCAGWIANCIDPNMLFLEENIQTIQSMATPPLLGRVDTDFVNLHFI